MSVAFGHPEDYLLYRGWEKTERWPEGEDPYYHPPIVQYHKTSDDLSAVNVDYHRALVSQVLADIQCLGGFEEFMRLVGVASAKQPERIR